MAVDIGDTVEILGPKTAQTNLWIGFRGVVLRVDALDGIAFLKPVVNRPDGKGRLEFWWETDWLKLTPR